MYKNNFGNHRMVFIDNIRSLLIVLVVFAHASITYSGVGGWYYIENNVEDMNSIQLIGFGFSIAFTAAYSMGFLFLLAGYFVPAAYDRKGFFHFVKGRLIRLGIPVLLFVFIINPFDFFILLSDYYGYSKSSFISNYKFHIINLDFLYDTGPLWFAFALLLFSILYAFFRVIMYKEINLSSLKKLPPNLIMIFLIILVTFLTFIVRLYYPIGTEFYNYQLCFFPQYIVLFILGLLFYRLNLLNKIPFIFGIKWFSLGLAFSLIFFAGAVYFGDAIDGDAEILFGGLHWQAAAYALWESITCASVVLGLIVIFRKWIKKPNKLSKFLSDHAFGVYVLHAPILIYISLIFIKYEIDPFIKTILISCITLPASFLVSYLIKKIKLFQYILS